MGNYIEKTQHKKAVRSVQFLAYLTLIMVLTDVVAFVAYSLRPQDNKDTFVFFIIILLSILGSAFSAAVGISLPHSGKFSYYKIPMHAFLLSEIIGLGNGIKTMTTKGNTFSDIYPYLFYTAFFLGCLVANIIILRFFFDSVSRKTGTVAVCVMILLILLHFGDIIYSTYNNDTFEYSIPSKQNMIRFISNFIFLLTAVSTLIIIRIKPKEHIEANILEQ